jgi:benzodiazapine receptor
MRRERRVPNEGWRWLVLLIVLINVSFNYAVETYLPGIDVVEAGNVYQSLYAPATYAHLIWAVIGLSVLIYAVYQLLPSQSEERIYDDLAKPFVLANAFSIGWIAAVRAGLFPVAMGFLVCTLAASIWMYIRVRDAVLRDDQSNWLSVPFSLMAAWLSVMTISHGSVLIISLDLQGTLSTQIVWTVVVILLSGVLGIGVCFRCRDYIFPAVISWASIAIFAARPLAYPYLGVVALIGAALPLIWIATTLFRRISYRQRVWSNKLSF